MQTSNIEDVVKVGEAAALLNLSEAQVRNFDAILMPTRNPWGWRLYSRARVLELAEVRARKPRSRAKTATHRFCPTCRCNVDSAESGDRK